MYIIKYTFRLVDDEAFRQAWSSTSSMNAVTGAFIDGEQERQSVCYTADEARWLLYDLKNIREKYPNHWMGSDSVTVGDIKVFRQLTLKEVEEIERAKK